MPNGRPTFLQVESNHNKTKKGPKKIIPWRRHHLRLDAAVRKHKSPCRHVDEDADAVDAAFIFNTSAIEKTIPPHTLAVVENDGSPLPLTSSDMPEEEGNYSATNLLILRTAYLASKL